jgi:hypothetical protein
LGGEAQIRNIMKRIMKFKKGKEWGHTKNITKRKTNLKRRGPWV